MKAFTEVKMKLYEKEETVKYREVILLWGKNYTPVKFVLTVSSRGKAIFVCMDTSISVVKIISGYSTRWSIEQSFILLFPAPSGPHAGGCSTWGEGRSMRSSRQGYF